MVIGEWEPFMRWYYDYINPNRWERLGDDEILNYLLYGRRGYGKNLVYVPRWFGETWNPRSFVVGPPEKAKSEPVISYRKIKVVSQTFARKPTADVIGHLDLTWEEPLAEVAKVVYRRRLLGAETTRLAKQIRPQVESALRSIRTSIQEQEGNK